MKKVKRYLSVILCMTIILGAFAPGVHATTAPVSDAAIETNVVTGKGFATYFCRTSDYSSVIYLNTTTGAASFAVIYSDAPTNVYDLTFTTDNTQLLTAAFWQCLSEDCFLRIRSVQPMYIPDVISLQPAELTKNTVNTRSTDINYFQDKLVNYYNANQHTNLLLQTSMVNGVWFDQKETLEFNISKTNTHKIKQTISVAGLIASIASSFFAPGLLSYVGLLASAAGVFPAGTELTEYIIIVFCERYVTTTGGSIIRARTYRYTTHMGYISTCSDDNICSDAQSPSYTPSKEFFDSSTQQFNAAYQNYLNP